jgi:iron complex outermembrane receptor protein
LRNLVLGLAFIGLVAPVAHAQDDDDDEDDTVDEVVVTGSRLKRDTFSSISPLQVISTQMSREIGTIDAASILQESSTAAGAQIDLTFNGLVLDNGPGASTINLRGLGDSRTLVLINGRRAAPAGVEGVPVSPDLNMIPSMMVQQYEVLLDGASSIYGSDAIAGVVNIIMRKDFEGFEVEGYTQVPTHDNGVQNTLSAAWGYTGDRGFFGIAAEYADFEAITFDDRPWTAGCNTHLEQTSDGQIRRNSVEYEFDYGMRSEPCKVGFARRAWDDVAQFGSIYWTPGTSNVGIPNLSEATAWGIALDNNGDGVPDVDFNDYNANGAAGGGYMFPELERISAMSYGEYTFAGEANITPYFEVLYNKREVYVFDGAGSNVDFTVPANNPWNPCNPDGVDGVDCGAAYDNGLMRNEYFEQDFAAIYGATPQFYAEVLGLEWLFNDFSGANPLGATPLRAQPSIIGHLDNTYSEVEQMRYVAGIKGDLPFIDWGAMDNWSFDVVLVHNDSNGTSKRTGVSEPNLRYSLETTVWDEQTNTFTCGNGSDGCVPVNLFAPSLYENLVNNDFATQAERDYVIVDRTFDTQYKQTLFNAYAGGDLFRTGAGDAMFGLGVEYRIDEIDSIPNDVAAEGQIWNYFADRGAVGEKYTAEFFTELELPIFAGNPGMEELTLNVSARYTDDEFYDSAWTYSAKMAYRPTDTLLLRATVGTSYRAPNLRELFIEGQTGFRFLSDPCVTPEDAVTPLGYDPSQDNRDPWVLSNCVAQGVDPTNLGIIASGQTTPAYFMEVSRAGGGPTLDPETSESWTAGFSFDQPWFDSFDMSIGATYYEVEMNDEIVELWTGYSIDACYNDINGQGQHPFCANLDRNLDGDGLINFTREVFVNQDARIARGVDINLAVDIPARMFGEAVDFGLDIVMNRKFELTEIYRDPNSGFEDEEDFVGQFGYPEWEGQGILRADFGNWRATWSTRYISSVAENPLAAEPFTDYPTGSGDTCLGEAFGDVQCRDIGWADNYFRHDASIYWRGSMWTFGAGVRNIKDEWPPQVDSDARIGAVYNNTPMGRGYDVFGRTYFVNVAASFQ